MCFSATASFAAAAATGIAGAVSVASARKTAHLLMAAIPLFFTVHQAAEGVVWLALLHDQYSALLRPAMFTFLGLARVAWPVVVPLAFLMGEREERRRSWLGVLLAIGIVLSAAVSYGLSAYPVSANVDGAHVQYRLDSPLPFRWVTDIVYAIVILASPLISSNRRIRQIGLLVMVTLIVSKIFYYWYFISVWCFFAALCSILIVLVIRGDGANDARMQPGGMPA
jgi:hypothetical protein